MEILQGYYSLQSQWAAYLEARVTEINYYAYRDDNF